jgi:hypothetical protein
MEAKDAEAEPDYIHEWLSFEKAKFCINCDVTIGTARRA